MKKEKIKVNGIRYKYIISEDKTLRVDGLVSREVYTTIEERLIKKGIDLKPSLSYQEKTTNHKIHYDEKYLERRFKNWAKIELKIYLEELEEKAKKKTITNEEKLCVQPIREELERRMKNDR